MDNHPRRTENDDPFHHLPDHEASIVRRQIETPVVTRITWITLFRYASPRDYMVITISSVCAIAAGAALPLNTVILGSLAGTFQDFTNGLSRDEFDRRVAQQSLYFVYLAMGECQCLFQYPIVM